MTVTAIQLSQEDLNTYYLPTVCVMRDKETQ